MIRPDFRRSLADKDTAPIKPTISIDPNAFKPIGGKPISIMMLTQELCRWPVDSPKAILFCGEPSEGEIYCCTHRAMSRGRGTLSERTALRDALRRDMSVVKESD